MDFRPVIDLCDKNNVSYIVDAKTSLLCSFKVGGYARLVLYPECIYSFCQLLDLIIEKNYKYFVIGNGTNIYFADYYDGIVIVTSMLSAVNVEDNKITALCGANISTLSRIALENSLSGLEFAYGIPSTVGGALYMNASAFGSSISQAVYESIVYDVRTKTTKKINLNEHRFGEKSSVFSLDKSYIILKTTLDLKPEKSEIIKEKMDSFLYIRKQSQPLNLPSAGSVFVKPRDAYASKLIDEAGLKGFKIGGIEVSKKHAGFFVNTENGTANDVNNLISYVKSVIKEKYNIDLKEEIIFIK